MKVFIDLGAHRGDTLLWAKEDYSGYDAFYAFEPNAKSFSYLKDKFGDDDSVVLIQAAASNADTDATFYNRESDISDSLCVWRDKPDSHATKVKTVDFSRFILDTFNCSDYIVLKINVEGAEYDILEKMIADDSISYINEIFCSWHWNKIDNFDKQRHDRLIGTLRNLNVDLYGEDKFDEYGYKTFRRYIARHFSTVPQRQYLSSLVKLIREKEYNIVELGVYYGASAFVLYRSMLSNNITGKLHLIDIYRYPKGEYTFDKPLRMSPDIELSENFSHDVERLLPNANVIEAYTDDVCLDFLSPVSFVFIDADHSTHSCLLDLLKYSQLSPQLLVLHDANKVSEAIQIFLNIRNEYQILDTKHDMIVLTNE